MSKNKHTSIELQAMYNAINGLAQKLPKKISILSYTTWKLLQGARHV